MTEAKKSSSKSSSDSSSAGASKSGAESANSLTPEVHFEEALEELETLVSQMESGDLSLDDSLKAFERGIALTRHCASALEAAELKVQTLTEEGTLEDFDSDSLDDA